MTTEMEFFKVGGFVRDSLLGIKSKDIDWAVVVKGIPNASEAFAHLVARVQFLAERPENVFLIKPDCFTVRALVKSMGGPVDFVMARKEFYNAFSRVPDRVEPGTLEDDLRRRDFTFNALALTPTGELIDLFNGERDLMRKVMDTPVDPIVTFLDDPLRVLRGIRFGVKLNMKFATRVRETIFDQGDEILEMAVRKVSDDRVRDELNKAFALNTVRALNLMRRNLPKGLFEFFVTAGSTSHLELSNKKV